MTLRTHDFSRGHDAPEADEARLLTLSRHRRITQSRFHTGSALAGLSAAGGSEWKEGGGSIWYKQKRSRSILATRPRNLGWHRSSFGVTRLLSRPPQADDPVPVLHRDQRWQAYPPEADRNGKAGEKYLV